MRTLEELDARVKQGRETQKVYQRKHKAEMYHYARSKGFTSAEASALAGTSKDSVERLAAFRTSADAKSKR